MIAPVPDADAVAGDSRVQDIITRALAEDIGTGDATSLALIDPVVRVRAAIETRHDAVISGCGVAAAVFAAVDTHVLCEALVAEGTAASAGAAVLQVTGPAVSILTAERTALNFMQRMTGIATLTRRFVERVAGTRAAILDTRKTTPSLRILEKYAVRCGGGENHRFGLFDRVLIKDNHRALSGAPGGLALDAAIRRARERYPDLAIEVEVESRSELEVAMAASPDWVLLDNMTPEELSACVKVVAGRARVEASGGINLESAAAVAATGVDAISLGCLTHSAPAADLSLEVTEILERE